MAFMPQQYTNIDKNRRPNSTNDMNENNNRRVQFTAMYTKNTANASSFKSLPNANPFETEESIHYQPSLDEYTNSHSNSPPKPTLPHNVKSIEIKKYSQPNPSNDSSPDSILNEPIPYTVCTQRDRFNSKSILLSPRTVLVDQDSHQITDEHTSDIDAKQQYYEQYQAPLTLAHTAKPALPNTDSIALTPTTNNHNDTVHSLNTLTFNQSIPAQSSNASKLSLHKHFSNDKQAFETWMACCDIQDDTFGYYSALYPLLCEIFAENTRCCRVPTQSDLEEVILKHGAKKMKISKLQQMTEMSHLNEEMSHLSGTITSDILNKLNASDNNPPDTPSRNMCKHMATVSGFTGTVSFDFDNPSSKPKYLVTIKYKSFFKFWKWFIECCKIIRELSHLWDANNQSALQCNLFCGREESQVILDQAPQGTFMLRLSSVIRGGVVLSYVEPSFSKKDKHFKHTILIRKNENEYELRSVKKNKSRKSNGKHGKQLTSISTLIRSFVKIKFLYTPLNLYPKKSIF